MDIIALRDIEQGEEVGYLDLTAGTDCSRPNVCR